MSIGKIVMEGKVTEGTVYRHTVNRSEKGFLIGGQDLIKELDLKGVGGQDIYIGIQKLDIWEKKKDIFDYVSKGQAGVRIAFDYSEWTRGDDDGFFLGGRWDGTDLLEILRDYKGKEIRLEIQFDESDIAKEDKKKWILNLI